MAITQTQVNTTLRYVGSNLVTLVTVLGTLSIVPKDQVQILIDNLHTLNDSLVTAYGALTKIWVIVGPIALIWLAKIGVSSSSVQGLVKSLMTQATSNTASAIEAKVAIVNAAANPAIGTKAIVNPELGEMAATADNVVAVVDAIK